MPLEPAEWQRYEPTDDGEAVTVVADMGALELRRFDVEDGPDAVTITLRPASMASQRSGSE
jgi:hypothetical protein